MNTLDKAKALYEETKDLTTGDKELLKRFNDMYRTIGKEIESTDINMSNIDYCRELSNARVALNRNRIRIFGK